MRLRSKWFLSLGVLLLSRSATGALFAFLVGWFIDYQMDKEEENRSTKRSNSVYIDFEVHLLSLCAIVIKSDGRTSQQELDYVRDKFVSLYGRDKANDIFRTFNEIIKHRKIQVEQICRIITMRSTPETRLEILHFLFEIAQVDGAISEQELYQIQRIASGLHIPHSYYNSIHAMLFSRKESDYEILGIPTTATEAEIKKAYREMAKKYHPDRVITEDEAIRKGAEEKFKKIQQAYERIQKQRGL